VERCSLGRGVAENIASSGSVHGRVGQRQHAVEFGQGEHGFGGHRVGDRVAVGGEHAAFERRAILARSPHQPYAAKMDRERELKIIRRAYAKQVTAAAGVGDPQVEAAFAAVAGGLSRTRPLAHRRLGLNPGCLLIVIVVP
jgi:hypothetical protein